jgi:chromate transporter
LELSLLFLRIGNTTVGGGDPTVTLLQRELSRRGWITAEQFGLAYALSRITPGTNMLAFCAGVGWYVLGIAGSVAAVLAVTIPSSALVLWLTSVCEMGERIPWLGAAVAGMIAAALGTMVGAAWMLAQSQINRSGWLVGVCILAASFVLARFAFSPIQILCVAAAAGLLWKPR